MNTSQSEFIFLDVGGRHFSTRKHILCPPNTDDNFFTAMVSQRWETIDKDGRYCVDRDPEIFSVILYFLRYAAFLPFPGREHALCDELRFYGIPVPYCGFTHAWFRATRHHEECSALLRTTWPNVSHAVKDLMDRMKSHCAISVVICEELERMVDVLSTEAQRLPSLKVKVAVATKEYAAASELMRLLTSGPGGVCLLKHVMESEHWGTRVSVEPGRLVVVMNGRPMDLDYKLDETWYGAGSAVMPCHNIVMVKIL